MGTSNFCKKNASKYFVILENYEDEETGEIMYPDEWEADEEIANINECLFDAVKGTDFDYEYFNPSDRPYANNDGMAIGSMTIDKSIGDINIAISLQPVIRSGYYEAATIDYDIEYIGDYDNYDLEYIDSYIEDQLENSDMNEGLKAMLKVIIKSWLEKTTEKIIDLAETVFEKVSHPLVCTGRFSDGTAVYM